MADFKESRKKYSDARRLHEDASQTLYLARQQAMILEKRVESEKKQQLLAALPANHPLTIAQAANLAVAGRLLIAVKVFGGFKIRS